MRQQIRRNATPCNLIKHATAKTSGFKKTFHSCKVLLFKFVKPCYVIIID